MTCILEHEKIENAVLQVCNYVESSITNEAMNWQDWDEQRLWVELVSCILGSRVHYETAKACSIHLHNCGLLDITKLVNNPIDLEKRIQQELAKPIYSSKPKKTGLKYRYPNSKARYITKTATQIYKHNKTTIKAILENSQNSCEARNILIKNCTGIGPKQASLFLRNISFCDDLAILDSHVMRFIKFLGLRNKFKNLNIKKTNTYFFNENILKLYAIANKKSLATLDIGIWIVMRTIQKDG